MEKEFSLSSLKQKYLVTASRRQAEQEKEKLEKEIADAAYQAEQMKKDGSEEYIRYRQEELSEKAMKENTDARKKESRKLQDRQKMLDRRLAEIDGNTEKRTHYLRTLMKCRKGTPLTAELLDEYVESIEVLPGNEVRISWK